MPVTLRRYTSQDAGDLWRLLQPAFRAGDTYTVDPEISEDAAIAFWCSEGKSVFLAETDRVVGTYYIKPNQGGGGSHICNCGFVTDPEARGQGVATGMLDHALMEARTQGYRAMQFNFVVATNTGAIRLWERAGFATVGRLPQAFRHPTAGYVDALIMFKSLLEPKDA